MCEDCIKKDVCKYREEVEKFKSKMPEPLQPECKYKREEPSDNWYILPNTETITADNWTTISSNS